MRKWWLLAGNLRLEAVKVVELRADATSRQQPIMITKVPVYRGSLWAVSRVIGRLPARSVVAVIAGLVTAALCTASCASAVNSHGPRGGQHAGAHARKASSASQPPFPVAENAKPGTGAWRLTSQGAPGPSPGRAGSEPIPPATSPAHRRPWFPSSRA